MKTTFKKISDSEVEMSFDCLNEQRRVTKTFSCPRGGGYVRDEEGKQVCDGLAYLGETLRVGEGELIDIIRYEYRAMRRREKGERQ